MTGMERDQHAPRTPHNAVATQLPTPDAVSTFLLANPGFLQVFLTDRLPMLADSLGVTRRRDGVVDLQAERVERLRRDLETTRAQTQSIIDASRANQSSMRRTHEAVVALMEAGRFEQLIETIGTDLAVILGLDTVCLLVESPPEGGVAERVCGVRVVEPGTTDALLGKNGVRLRADIAGEEAVFGPMAGIVRSDALLRVPITEEAPPAVLALGSRDAAMFSPEMATELLEFLARALGRCIAGWLAAS